MIRDITISDENEFKKLGLLISSNFNDVYHLMEELNNPIRVIKVYDDGEIKGFLHYEILSNETNIINIAIKKKYRRHHIADKLLNDMFLTNKFNTFLEVSEDNYAAISLYKKHGFIEIGVRKGYYNGVDAITMVKKI